MNPNDSHRRRHLIPSQTATDPSCSVQQGHAQPCSQYPHHHPYVKMWSDINLLTEFPGCFQRRVSHRLRALRAAACFTDETTIQQMEAWYEPIRAPQNSRPISSSVCKNASQSHGDEAQQGARVTRQRQEEEARRKRAAPLLSAITQKMHLLPLEEQSPSGTSSAHTSDAAAGLAMLAGNDGACLGPSVLLSTPALPTELALNWH